MSEYPPRIAAVWSALRALTYAEMMEVAGSLSELAMADDWDYTNPSEWAALLDGHARSCPTITPLPKAPDHGDTNG